MLNASDLEKTTLDGQVQILFTRCVTELKKDAQEIEVLREEIRVVIARTAAYFARPLTFRPLESVTPK